MAAAQERKRIAIVGSGISALATLWTLRSAGHTVTLFEKADRLGGHTNTAIWTSPTNATHSTPVDTGFIVMNTATYPNFIAFLAALGVKTMASQMTFGVSRDGGAFEWSGSSLGALFAQRENVVRPAFWRMVFDVVRFNAFALDLLSPSSGGDVELTIGEYLEREGYSDAFRDDYLIPMTACVWSTGPEKCALEFPAVTLVRFMWNHHLLSTVAARPPWLTVEGGAQRYVDAVVKVCAEARIELSTPVEALRRVPGGRVELTLGGARDGAHEVFDEVVLACHGDQARWIMGNAATPVEKEILEAFETTPNTAYLHSDLSLMPTRPAAWSAWNYLTTSSSPTSSTTVSLTYHMNVLQNLSPSLYGPILVTLNPLNPPSPALTQATYSYRHPLYTARSVAAQEQLDRIQGKDRVWFAGAWTGYGFHEDGFASGMRVGLALGGSIEWEVQDAKFSRGRVPGKEWQQCMIRAIVTVVQAWIWIIGAVVGVERQGMKGRRARVKGL